MAEREPTSPTMTSDEFPARPPPPPTTTNQSAPSLDDVTSGRRRPRRRYVGYIPELLRALAALLDFRYELYPVADASYGYRKASSWTGLIGELVDEVRANAWSQ